MSPVTKQFVIVELVADAAIPPIIGPLLTPVYSMKMEKTLIIFHFLP